MKASLLSLAVVLGIPSIALADARLTEARFDQLIADFQSRVGALLATQGQTLEVQSFWSQEVPAPEQGGGGGATAYRDGPHNVVLIAGGLARNPIMSDDGISAALCHELGHAQVGVEEQKADEYAARICLPALWKGSLGVIFDPPIPQLVGDQCDRAHPDSAGRVICRRVTSAGLCVADFRYWYWTHSNPNGYPYTRPDFSRAAASSLDIGQCSLDIYRSIALGAGLPQCFTQRGSKRDL
jgi:hypothetical protein